MNQPFLLLAIAFSSLMPLASEEIDFRSEYQRGANCGINTLYGILRLCNHQIDYSHVKSIATIEREGCSTANLMDWSQQLGLPLVAIRATSSSLAGLPAPMIAHMGNNSSGHFVLITQIDRQTGIVAGIDGTTCEFFDRLPISTFVRDWSGVILVTSANLRASHIKRITWYLVAFLSIANMAVWLPAAWQYRATHASSR